MAVGLDWINEIKKMSSDKKKKYDKAIEILMAWPMFKQEYGWTGLEMLKHFLENK